MLDHVGICLNIASLPHMDYLGLNEGLLSKNEYYFDTRIHFWGVESMPMCLNLGLEWFADLFVPIVKENMIMQGGAPQML